MQHTTLEWITGTPGPDSYQLAMFRDGSDIQFIEVSRAEFVSLKRHLAELRGLQVSDEVTQGMAKMPDPSAAGPSLVQDEPEKPARGLDKEPTMTARLVVMGFNGCIRELKEMRDSFVLYQGEPGERGEGTAKMASVLLLQEILRDWNNGCFDDTFPGEQCLVAAILGNLDIECSAGSNAGEGAKGVA